MSEAKWIDQLQTILDCPVRQLQLPVQQWKAQIDESESFLKYICTTHTVTPGDYMVVSKGPLWFALGSDSEYVDYIEVERAQLTDKEMRLIGWSLTQIRSSTVKNYEGVTESERFARELGAWIVEQLDTSESQISIPDRLMARGRLFSNMIPFLLVSEQLEVGRTSYSDLEKLLRTFLAEDMMLIPLKEQEWLVLGPISLIRDAQSEERDEESEESVEESLEPIAYGLHEMLASEWIGECHLAVAPPISPANSIVATTALLRETVHLGRAFHVGSNIHLPWLLHLERLLNTIPEMQRAKFVEQALKRTDFFLETEILTTLETFFDLDCNVSETAKKLYIHRNTLLYRLDKLKQETELDVRLFRDAVLVKIILLLYKVTKRK
ncbi:PucR family transcriptional regulator [Paenibacillus nasutitermitis]|uniref:PucR C-terminal helix-turn-helix domain-containing protein n=1 Tax=Paenibacillus nasutitermitis TaxID=1652958 RepID=A0A916ZHW2_9BACL|nr:helix-turn-helix domain-containing protein [Paenibacillus nasutitermitis]GGD98767.1 hypothetical protein GCM10010911_66990 [Paenibacillus nasutitermitis]